MDKSLVVYIVYLEVQPCWTTGSLGADTQLFTHLKK